MHEIVIPVGFVASVSVFCFVFDVNLTSPPFFFSGSSSSHDRCLQVSARAWWGHGDTHGDTGCSLLAKVYVDSLVVARVRCVVVFGERRRERETSFYF